jgi:hypothetical protein
LDISLLFLLNFQTDNSKISKIKQISYSFFSKIKEENSGIINNENTEKFQIPSNNIILINYFIIKCNLIYFLYLKNY